jgi:hypothetical protein
MVMYPMKQSRTSSVLFTKWIWLYKVRLQICDLITRSGVIQTCAWLNEGEIISSLDRVNQKGVIFQHLYKECRATERFVLHERQEPSRFAPLARLHQSLPRHHPKDHLRLHLKLPAKACYVRPLSKQTRVRLHQHNDNQCVCTSSYWSWNSSNKCYRSRIIKRYTWRYCKINRITFISHNHCSMCARSYDFSVYRYS